MGTLRQKRVAKAMVDNLVSNKPKTAGQVLESIGYSKSIAKNPQMVLEAVGVKEELANLGFSVEGADGVVQEILYKGKSEKTRLTAANLVYERLGAKAPDKKLNVNVDVKEMDEEIVKKIAEKLRVELRGTIGGSGVGGISGGADIQIQAKE